MVHSVTALIKPVEFEAGDYRFSLPPDMPLGIVRRMDDLGKALNKGIADISLEETEQLDEEVWACFGAVMERADPPAPKPLRSIFTFEAVADILGFLAEELATRRNSQASSPSPTLSTAPSPSENSASHHNSSQPVSVTSNN